MPSAEHIIASYPTFVQQSEPERCTDVWFDDGNCVLQAENMVFKVYTGILSKHSALFETLFTIPQPQVDCHSLTYEGCPLVQLQDKAQAIHYLLKALFDLQFYADVTKIKDAEIVITIVQMSLKYDISILLRRSIMAFTALYPPALAKWDIRAQRRQHAPFVAAYGRALPYVAIELAKKTGMEVLLPAAMFECCSYSIADIMDGVQTPDGKLVHLDHDSKRAVLQARVQLSLKARDTKMRIVHDAELEYHISRRSSDMQKHWDRLTDWAQATDGPDAWANPLNSLSGWPSDAFSRVVRGNGAKITTATIRNEKSIVKGLRDDRSMVWRDLPTAFGLTGWDKMKRAWIH